MTRQTREKIKVLLLENIHPLARQIFEGEGFEVETVAGALTPAQLIEKIPGFHVLGIRSKTSVTAEVFEAAHSLITLGAFCIGTNHIDLKAARKHGIPVFNAPFGNTRSVAEMTIAQMIMLSRKLGDRNNEVHRGIWNKSHEGCYEVRGKTLGIVGYGNIGTQVSTLAEALGMRVLFHDIVPKLPRGNAKGCATLDHILQESDFVSLHVPATPLTHKMMSTPQFKHMKPGSYLINAARGTVVDIPAMIQALKAGPLAGAAIDVFPSEPELNTQDFKSELQNLENVILTPHIGGATEEAQTNIGEEVPTALIRHVTTGSTIRSVNFPEADAPPTLNNHRILNVHRNVPGVLREINRIVADLGANIEAEHLTTDPELGYLILDTNAQLSLEVKKAIAALETSIMTRIVY